jgi:hypothetical protein
MPLTKRIVYHSKVAVDEQGLIDPMAFFQVVHCFQQDT